MKFGACDGKCSTVAAQARTIEAQAEDLKFLRERVTTLEAQLAEIAGVRATLPPRPALAPGPTGRPTPALPMPAWANMQVGGGHANLQEARDAHRRAHGPTGPSPSTGGHPKPGTDS